MSTILRDSRTSQCGLDHGCVETEDADTNLHRSRHPGQARWTARLGSLLVRLLDICRRGWLPGCKLHAVAVLGVTSKHRWLPRFGGVDYGSLPKYCMFQSETILRYRYLRQIVRSVRALGAGQDAIFRHAALH